MTTKSMHGMESRGVELCKGFIMSTNELSYREALKVLI